MKLLIFLASTLLLAACVAQRTTSQSSWTDEAYSGLPIDRIAVVALFDTRADSLAFERNVAHQLFAGDLIAQAAFSSDTDRSNADADSREPSGWIGRGRT